MFKRFWEWLFPSVEVGSIWWFQPQNPFHSVIRQEVVAVKNGWVQLRNLSDDKIYETNIGLLYKVFTKEK